MKKLVLTAFIASLTAVSATADITVNFSQTPMDGKVLERYIPIQDMIKSRTERRAATVTDTLKITDGKLTIAAPSTPSHYTLVFSEQSDMDFFAAPGENIVIDVKSIDPLQYDMKGTELVEGIQSLETQTAPITKQIMEMRKQETPDENALNDLFKAYTKIYADFIASNPDNAAAPYATLYLEDEDMMKAVENLSEAARKSIIMPYVMKQYDSMRTRIEQKKQQDALQSGNVDAPAFTLKNPEGNNVSLADFKGKWVILDFWGTWCPWCIKGFPGLKEAYAKYAGKLEIIGIDCGDTVDTWKAGVKKYSLPWVQVYNPDYSTLTAEYFVSGFPTKVIVNPEGKIANITVGEDPAFFTVLAKLIGE